ncbi:MAG: hypothetical protein D6B25_00015 [Desulfobulbaceae bacterium]|nr:MAG: hypothetical protein D6B25_00015 [Desulfobulbaceae bacterium]
MRILLAMVLPMVLLLSCAETNQSITQVDTGESAPTLVGQPVGRSPEATLMPTTGASTVLGVLMINEMDRYDRQQVNNACEKPTSDQPVIWINPRSGKTFQVTPGMRSQDGELNRECRDAEIGLLSGGIAKKADVTACRSDQGQWVLKNRTTEPGS